VNNLASANISDAMKTHFSKAAAALKSSGKTKAQVIDVINKNTVSTVNPMTIEGDLMEGNDNIDETVVLSGSEMGENDIE